MDNWNNFNLNPFNRMNNNNNNFYSPPAMHYEIIQVNGEAGAKNFRMAPNSNALLLDSTAAIIWFAQTDGTGYLTVTPYDFSPHKQQPEININDLAARVSRLEGVIDDKSNSFSNKQSKRQRNSSTDQGHDESNSNG